ncbi:MAG: hypothetical protein GWN01_11085, partial [Nitrosopumilaceae archaeon]|nr:hypothetical protein [Nitrosopumilaceae archaeon]NIU86826.1 hypothetical protein [Nitrosopumilaceae archaeon]NIV65707.1 hypothetical protein [Nitrosopumilaceae archaeon]NIX62030.1 hypothetical protein [Nitrosopumilaceae archaeon]
VAYMIAANAYSGLVIRTTPNSVFEEEFSKIPEVSFFVEKYPNHTMTHLSDFLGWKIILYGAEIDDGKSV